MKFSEDKFIKWLTVRAGTIMMIGFLASLILCLIIDLWYFIPAFGEVMGKVGIFFGIVFPFFLGGLRGISAIAGIYEFSSGKEMTGIFGMLISLIITIFVVFHYWVIGSEWQNDFPKYSWVLKMSLQVLVWSGALLELRMIWNAWAEYKMVKKDQEKESKKDTEIDVNIDDEKVKVNGSKIDHEKIEKPVLVGN